MLKPLGDKLILKQEKQQEENKTLGGIVVNSAQDTKAGNITARGIVTAIGPEVETIKAGDSVYYESHGAHRVTADGSEFQIISINNILCINEVG